MRLRCFACVLAAGMLVMLVMLIPSVASADAVDDAFVRGNESAERSDWPSAVEAYREARGLLPTRSALLDYNLGTAYAEVGDLGAATYYLERATDPLGDPTSDLVEAARGNLAVVRRQIDLQATTNGTLVDRPRTSWDLIVEGVEATRIGWLALLCGWGFLAVLLVHRRQVQQDNRALAVTRSALIVLALGYLVPGVLHGWALRAATANPKAIVLSGQADAREGPGRHNRVEFTLQGGAKVRVMDRAPGWQRVQLPGGLSGWVPEQSLGRLDAR